MYNSGLTHCMLQIIEGAAKEESFSALALREGIGKVNCRMPYRLGVDARYVCPLSWARHELEI